MNATPNPKLTEQLHQALELWVELTGVDPGATRWSINLGGGMDSYTVSKMHKAIKEALDLDPTNVTGHLLLDAFSTQYFQGRKFSVEELMEHPERTAEYVAKTKAFRALAQSPEIQDIGASFALSMRQALRHYGADTDATMAVLADPHELAFLRRDALRSMEGLRVDQFLKGSPEPAGVQPAYNGVVHQVWNINSLINLACRQPAGVTLNLVRDPDDFQSYFAFAIRNGGNLFVLSDVPVHCHPLQRYMSRRPDRAFEDRAVRNWFPYNLLDIKCSEEGRLYFDHSGKTALVPLNQEADQLKSLPELHPSEIVWLVMMFDLIVERFWRKGFQSPELTYTAQMIREETPLIDAATRANLPVIGYQTLALPALTVADVRHDTISPTVIGSDGGSPNRWMEDRYAGRVTDEVINLVGLMGTDHYLPPAKIDRTGGRGCHDHKNHETALVSANLVVSVNAKADSQLPFWNREGRYALHALDAASFGTKQEIEDNRGFLARHNLAKAVQRLADEEFEARKDEITDWWKKTIEKNIDLIYSMAVVPEVWRPKAMALYPQSEIAGGGWIHKNYFQFTQVCDTKDYTHHASLKEPVWLTQGYRSRGDNFTCYINGTASSHRVEVRPQTAADLAYLARCEISDLPDVLQHWCASSTHAGNHLLNRIDPMAWVLHNPWEKLSFGVVLHLSTRALRKLEKDYTPPEGWERPKKEDAGSHPNPFPHVNDEASDSDEDEE